MSREQAPGPVLDDPRRSAAPGSSHPGPVELAVLPGRPGDRLREPAGAGGRRRLPGHQLAGRPARRRLERRRAGRPGRPVPALAAGAARSRQCGAAPGRGRALDGRRVPAVRARPRGAAGGPGAGQHRPGRQVDAHVRGNVRGGSTARGRHGRRALRGGLDRRQPRPDRGRLGALELHGGRPGRRAGAAGPRAFPRYRGGNVRHVVVEGGAHFPWIERPEAVGQAFAGFASTLSA